MRQYCPNPEQYPTLDPMSFLDRERIIAGRGFSRWLVPPAALAVHLSIGQVYAFSVFKIPLTQSIGITHSVSGDWDQPALAWIFSIAIAFLGISAAVFGRWVEENGPRKTMFAAACCFGGGFLIAALGVALASALARLSRLRRARRMRTRARLHFAGLDVGEMVPGPAGYGHWHGDHGIWRRRFHRLQPEPRADGCFQVGHPPPASSRLSR